MNRSIQPILIRWQLVLLAGLVALAGCGRAVPGAAPTASPIATGITAAANTPVPLAVATSAPTATSRPTATALAATAPPVGVPATATESTTGGSMPTAAGYDIRYSSVGARPFVDARLEIHASGAATLYLGSSASLPPGGSEVVGFFAGSVDPAKLADVQSYITRRKLASASATATPASPETTMRTLVLTRADQVTTIEIADDASTALKGVEERLLAIMADVSRMPVRALRADLQLTADTGGIEPTVTLTQVGAEPLDLELFDPNIPQRFVRVLFEIGRSVKLPSGGAMWQPLATTNLSRDQVATLASAGTIPSGSAQLRGDASYAITLPAAARPAASDAQAAATVSLRIADAAGDWRNVTVRSAVVMLP